MSEIPSIQYLKRIGVALKRRLAERDHEVKLTKCHEAIAAGFGFRTYAAMLANGGPNSADHYENDTAERLNSILDDPIPRADLLAAIRDVIELTVAGAERFVPA